MTVKGKIKWVNNERGYGFIDCGSGEDIFFASSVFKNKEPLALYFMVIIKSCLHFLSLLKITIFIFE